MCKRLNNPLRKKPAAWFKPSLQASASPTNTLKNTIKSLDISTNKITTQVNLAQNNLNQTTYTIQDTGLKIQDKQQQINQGNLVIRNALRQLREADTKSILEVLLSNQSLTDFWTEIESTAEVQAKISDQVRSVTYKNQSGKG